jgi:hypothetical protein
VTVHHLLTLAQDVDVGLKQRDSFAGRR